MRWRSSRGRPASRLQATAPVRSGLALAERRDADRHQLVAALANDLETKAVKGEGLAGFGDHLGLVDHEARNGGRLVVGQMPAMHAIEVADRDGAVDDIAAGRFSPDPHGP